MRPGDVVTVALDRTVRVLKVWALPSAAATRTRRRVLCEDLSPPPCRAQPSEPQPPAVREAGTGRPTKRERRAIDRFTARRRAD